MPVDSLIKDGTGSKRAARVDTRNRVEVSMHTPDVPEAGEENRLRYYSELVGSAGASSGNVNMNVDGSVTPAAFFARSEGEADVHITEIVIYLEDSKVANKKFGDINSLTNGWDLQVEESGVTTSIVSKAKNGGQILVQTSPPIFGTDANKLNRVGDPSDTGENEGFLVSFNISESLPGGIRLGRGTQDRIVSIVNDDLTGLADFEVRLIGYRHYP